MGLQAFARQIAPTIDPLEHRPRCNTGYRHPVDVRLHGAELGQCWRMEGSAFVLAVTAMSFSLRVFGRLTRSYMKAGKVSVSLPPEYSPLTISENQTGFVRLRRSRFRLL